MNHCVIRGSFFSGWLAPGDSGTSDSVSVRASINQGGIDLDESCAACLSACAADWLRWSCFVGSVVGLEAAEEIEGGYRGLAEKFFKDADRNGQADLSITALGDVALGREKVLSIEEGVVALGERAWPWGSAAWAALASQTGGSGAVPYQLPVAERS